MTGYQADMSGLTLHVRLTPNAGRDELVGWAEAADGAAHFVVRVRAVPEKGKANKSLVALLAKTFGIAKRDVDVIRGATSRLKTVRIEAAKEARDGIIELLESYRA